jgi:Protein of unknown function (DUF2637)
MTSWQASNGGRPTGADGALRAVGLAAVCLGVAALAAGTFVLSYHGIRAIALQAGIGSRYARGYPLLIDAMLVIALASVLALRAAGLPSRILSWLTLVVVLAAAAGADTLHATGRRLPHNAAVITAAVLPWALVFVAFVLLLAMLRHARLRHQATVALAEPAWPEPVPGDQRAGPPTRPALPPPLPVRSPQPWPSVSVVPGFTSQLVSSAAAGAAAGAAAADPDPWAQGSTPFDDAGPQLADAEPDEAALATEPATATDELDPEVDEPDDEVAEADTQSDEAPIAHIAEDLPHDDEPQEEFTEDDVDMPVFHRMWSSPAPPEDVTGGSTGEPTG